jgi:hypothetical protein
MEEIFPKIAEFFDYMAWWLNEYIFSGLLGFIGALITLFIKVLEFCISILQWMMSFLG